MLCYINIYLPFANSIDQSDLVTLYLWTILEIPSIPYIYSREEMLTWEDFWYSPKLFSMMASKVWFKKIILNNTGKVPYAYSRKGWRKVLRCKWFDEGRDEGILDLWSTSTYLLFLLCRHIVCMIYVVKDCAGTQRGQGHIDKVVRAEVWFWLDHLC